jgi:hypothetical protein
MVLNSHIAKYISYGQSHKWLHEHNWRLWQHCDERKTRFLCWDPEFLNEMCNIFPYQAMKTVRMRLSLAEELLHDSRLKYWAWKLKLAYITRYLSDLEMISFTFRFNLKVLHLVRDPRAIIVSRKFRKWCPSSEDCSSPQSLCSDMVDDFKAAATLRKKYRGRFA